MPAPAVGVAALIAPLVVPVADKGLSAWRDHNDTKRYAERQETMRAGLVGVTVLVGVAVGVKHLHAKWKVSRLEKLEAGAEARGDSAAAEAARDGINDALAEPSGADTVLGGASTAVETLSAAAAAARARNGLSGGQASTALTDR